jgi:ABC-2 type transport system permease protein
MSVVSASATGATARRVALQLRNDPRTVALLLVVPCALIALLRWVFDSGDTFDRIGGPLLGVFPLLSMFLVTSVAMLRERTTGTLERILTLPVGKLDILLGYAVAFGVVAVVQGTLVTSVALGLLGLEVAGPTWAIVLLCTANALLGSSLGLLVSAFARSEFQAVQFLPAFLLPQLLLCGLMTPRDQMAPALEAVSRALPMTYAYDALDRVVRDTGDAGGPTAVVLACTVLALCAGAVTLRRRTA